MTQAEEFFKEIWENVLARAEKAKLDTSKLGDDHRLIVQQIADYLASEDERLDEQHNRKMAIDARSRRKQELFDLKKSKKITPAELEELNTIDDEPILIFDPVAPIIICGPPGTGKTTFLYLLDAVLRHDLDIEDNIRAKMRKGRDRVHYLQKRTFEGDDISLLSVRKWSELLHFYAWDVRLHKFANGDLEVFIEDKLLDMKVLFADEVELSGYSPTLPNLAQFGLLVIGTSNQVSFPQLDVEDISPQIVMFDGEDMRSGDPADAIVTASDPAWEVFETALDQEPVVREHLNYRYFEKDGNHFIHLDFGPTMRAPLLETDWSRYLNDAWGFSAGSRHAIGPDSNLIVLFEDYSLELLRTNYNAIMRYISFFDAIEQMGIGLLVRNQDGMEPVSKEAMEHIKVTIHTARGVVEEVKQRTLVGIDRSTSRIGKAGIKAQKILEN